jgi:hypothetical protein
LAWVRQLPGLAELEEFAVARDIYNGEGNTRLRYLKKGNQQTGSVESFELARIQPTSTSLSFVNELARI